MERFTLLTGILGELTFFTLHHSLPIGFYIVALGDAYFKKFFSLKRKEADMKQFIHRFI